MKTHIPGRDLTEMKKSNCSELTTSKRASKRMSQKTKRMMRCVAEDGKGKVALVKQASEESVSQSRKSR